MWTVCFLAKGAMFSIMGSSVMGKSSGYEWVKAWFMVRWFSKQGV
jgi:hypothetical protein